MTREKRTILLEEMKKAVRDFRDAKINADYLYTEETIKNNKLQYLTGLQYAMELMTGKTWAWSNGETGLDWAVVEIDNNGKQRYYRL